MDGIKIVLIGGGSYGWSPTFMTDIAINPALKGAHIVLMDTDPATLELMVPLGRKIAAAAGAQLAIEGTTDLAAALPGADFVGLTISTGGDEANRLDHMIPARYGVYQTVGDTVGPGGWSRTLRNIPVVVDILRQVERLAPRAWFMNYSNPMTTLTRTATRVSSVRSMGICHELQGCLLHCAYYFGVDWEKDFSVTMAGINHLIWILSMTVKGRDGLALLRKYGGNPDGFEKIGPLGIPAELVRSGGAAPSQRIKLDLLERTGALPAAGDAHIVEFFPHYLRTIEEANRWGFLKEGHRAHTFARTGSRQDRRKKCEEMLGGTRPLELVHSHEHADYTIAALAGTGAPLLTPLNLPNRGQIDNLPREAVVETLAHVDGDGVRPLAVGNLPPAVLGPVMRHVPNQEMLVEAGLTGNRELAVLALAGDPLVPDPDTAVKMAADFFEEFKKQLPQFNGRWSL